MHLVPFVPSESPISGKCKQRCLSPFVTLVMMEGIALIVLSNLGTRFFLRGVGCDALGF
jgi:hypothetical protein